MELFTVTLDENRNPVVTFSKEYSELDSIEASSLVQTVITDLNLELHSLYEKDDILE